MKEFTVKENLKLKEFTDNYYPQGSFYFNRLLKNKDIKVNGVKTDRNIPLKKGDKVVYYTTPKQESLSAYEIVYEDENILVCDKESGVNSEAVFNSLSERYNCYFIHRLDRNTQGLMVFTKNKESESELLRAFKERLTEKKYLALCVDNFKRDSAVLVAYLKKDEKNSLVKISEKEGFGEKIITEYGLLSRYGKLALVEVTLHTGKTHQIRAHLSHIGCPVLGDEKYGDNALNESLSLKRQCLISHKLSFKLDGKLSYLNSKTFTSNKNFQNILNVL